jgi:hypothetical protein
VNYPTLTLLDFSAPHGGDRRLTLDADGKLVVTRKVQPGGASEAMITMLLDAEALALLGTYATTLAAQKREAT